MAVQPFGFAIGCIDMGLGPMQAAVCLAQIAPDPARAIGMAPVGEGGLGALLAAGGSAAARAIQPGMPTFGATKHPILASIKPATGHRKGSSAEFK